MLKSVMALTLAFSVSGAFAQAKKAAAETYKLDTAATKVEWVGKKVTGEHRGFVSVKEGTLSVSGDAIQSGTIVVDVNSMTVTDITDKDTADKFIGHMKSPDFFDTAKYPEAKLVITKSTKTKDGLEVQGNLTVLGKTQPVKFTATQLKKENGKLTANALVTVDRTKFGLKYGSGQFFKGLGDKMIYDDFTLNIQLVANKQ